MHSDRDPGDICTPQFLEQAERWQEVFVRLIAVQFDIVWENKQENYRQVRTLLDQNPPPGNSLIVLPEMFATGFTMNASEMAEEQGGPTEDFLATMCRDYQSWVLGGLIGKRGEGYVNEVALLNPEGQTATRYVKRHPFSYSDEGIYYAAGETLELYDLGGFILSPFICYDLRFPEDFRSAVRNGANLFVVVANWPASRDRHWRVLLEARAVENQSFVVGVNRCGKDPQISYAGHTMIFHPRGDVLAAASTEESFVSAEIDLSAVEDYRRAFPALNDMHDDFKEIGSISGGERVEK